jgi:hypothetical protein
VGPTNAKRWRSPAAVVWVKVGGGFRKNYWLSHRLKMPKLVGSYTSRQHFLVGSYTMPTKYPSIKNIPLFFISSPQYQLSTTVPTLWTPLSLSPAVVVCARPAFPFEHKLRTDTHEECSLSRGDEWVRPRCAGPPPSVGLPAHSVVARTGAKQFKIIRSSTNTVTGSWGGQKARRRVRGAYGTTTCPLGSKEARRRVRGAYGATAYPLRSKKVKKIFFESSTFVRIFVRPPLIPLHRLPAAL